MESTFLPEVDIDDADLSDWVENLESAAVALVAVTGLRVQIEYKTGFLEILGPKTGMSPEQIQAVERLKDMYPNFRIMWRV